MNKPEDSKSRPVWTSAPVPCEDCARPIEYDFWRPGPTPRVCRSCQNKRYRAKTKGTPEGERLRKRKMLLGKLRRVETRLARDRLTLVQVRKELKKTARGKFPQPSP